MNLYPKQDWTTRNIEPNVYPNICINITPSQYAIRVLIGNLTHRVTNMKLVMNNGTIGFDDNYWSTSHHDDHTFSLLDWVAHSNDGGIACETCSRMCCYDNVHMYVLSLRTGRRLISCIRWKPSIKDYYESTH